MALAATGMTEQQKLDLQVAGQQLARAIEEIVFATMHNIQSRRDPSIRAFGEAMVKFGEALEAAVKS